ncbi:PglL family O-oligosaccharyltransferase [Citrobacter braakii]|uniref:PglL family O-oligosaccharyltransferase n=1 Tax=Citrobacter braakii TaxID=57706 RepID=UPI0011404D99|nr:O-antigen ligase family protein [Citrobacter braakii]MCY9801614.1 Wzy polymerase domain-containing protein [Citrobacter braakii]MDL4386212.1 Wzy polymerase domain-containing protein [Citrobacter braakii]
MIFKASNKFSSIPPCSPLLLLLLVIIQLPSDNVSAAGLNSAHSLATWGVMAMQSLVIIAYQYKKRGFHGVHYCVWLALALLLMNVSFITAYDIAWRINALHRAAFMLMLTCIFWLLLQYPVTYSDARLLIGVLAISAFFQAVVIMLQLYTPFFAWRWLHHNPLAAEGRPLGMFGQVNLLGSFLATGLGATLWSVVQCRRKNSIFAWVVILLTIGFALYLTHSRTGWLGATIAMVGLVIFSPAKMRRKTILLITGLIVGCWLLVQIIPSPGIPILVPAEHQMQSPADKTAINSDAKDASAFSLERMRAESSIQRRQMLEGSVALIKQHPLLGAGAGSFESVWPDALASTGQVSSFEHTVTHPHNEILFVLAEGGIVALSGLLLFAGIFCIPLIKGSHRSRTIWALTLPIALHCMTEYPFYLSAVHAVIFLLLLRLSWPVRLLKPREVSLSLKRFILIAVGGLCLWGMFFLHTAWQTRAILRTAEISGLTDTELLKDVPNSIAQYDRLQFNRCVSELMAFNQTRKTSHLNQFERCASAWLHVHNDANVTASLITIAKSKGDLEAAEQWRIRGHRDFPFDPRFLRGDL